MKVMSDETENSKGELRINLCDIYVILLATVTFEQQGHEGDVGRTELGHGQSVRPVVA